MYLFSLNACFVHYIFFKGSYLLYFYNFQQQGYCQLCSSLGKFPIETKPKSNGQFCYKRSLVTKDSSSSIIGINPAMVGLNIPCTYFGSSTGPSSLVGRQWDRSRDVSLRPPSRGRTSRHPPLRRSRARTRRRNRPRCPDWALPRTRRHYRPSRAAPPRPVTVFLLVVPVVVPPPTDVPVVLLLLLCVPASRRPLVQVGGT